MLFVPQITILDPMSSVQIVREMKDFVKYLGIMVDSDLSWKNHIDFICHKNSKSIRIIAKLSKTLYPMSSLINYLPYFNNYLNHKNYNFLNKSSTNECFIWCFSLELHPTFSEISNQI